MVWSVNTTGSGLGALSELSELELEEDGVPGARRGDGETRLIRLRWFCGSLARIRGGISVSVSVGEGEGEVARWTWLDRGMLDGMCWESSRLILASVMSSFL